MVGDDTQAHVLLMALTIGRAGDSADLAGNIHHRINIKEGLHVLAHAGQTLQARAHVDVLLLQLGVIALAVVVELAEHVVPDFNIPVAVAAHGAARFAAAVLRAAVIVDLGAGAAGTGAVLPEVVRLTEAENALSRDAHVLVPDFKRLLVGGRGLVPGKDGGIEPVCLQPQPLRAGQEFPAPGDGLLFEVVSKGEVAQHLKVRAVAGGLADVFNVAGTDALLTGADPVARRFHFAGEVGLHGGHAAVDQQQAGVVLGDEGEAGQAQVLLCLVELQEHFTDFIDSI